MNLKKMFDNHNDWRLETYKATNEKTGITLWTSNGWCFFDSYNGTLKLGFIERFFLFRHFKNMCKRKALGYDR